MKYTMIQTLTWDRNSFEKISLFSSRSGLLVTTLNFSHSVTKLSLVDPTFFFTKS